MRNSDQSDFWPLILNLGSYDNWCRIFRGDIADDSRNECPLMVVKGRVYLAVYISVSGLVCLWHSKVGFGDITPSFEDELLYDLYRVGVLIWIFFGLAYIGGIGSSSIILINWHSTRLHSLFSQKKRKDPVCRVCVCVWVYCFPFTVSHRE